MEEYVNNNQQFQEEDELEIDWMGILTKLLKSWKKIILIGFIFGVLGIVSALMMTRKWNVTMTLAPEIQREAGAAAWAALPACWAWAVCNWVPVLTP